MDGLVALGMVLAMLVDGKGKAVPGGSGRGQLYVSPEGLVVLKPTARQELFRQLTNGALILSIVVVVGNLFTVKHPAAIWIAVALQAVYWLSFGPRRRLMEPEPLGATAFADAARKRTLVQAPAGRIISAVPPQPPKRGLRKPARFLLADGALEMYLSEDQYRQAIQALGRRE
jgi:hypothetical protein